MTEKQLQVQTCIPKTLTPTVNGVASYVLPEAPRLSAARFAGACAARHVHQYFEIVYIERGAGLHSIGNRTVAATAGDVFLIAPGEVHDTSALKDACKWVVAFGADALNATHSDAVAFETPTDFLLLLAFFRPRGVETEHVHLDPAEQTRWVDLLQRLERELSERQFGYEDAARALLVLLLTDIARQTFAQEPSFAMPSRLLARLFRFVEVHFREPISLRDVAASVDYAPAYLTDLVRRETGRTVLEWIVERRMAEARFLLRETEQTVQQVAVAIGYRHTSHFITQFKRLHGMTPNVWRDAQLQGQERKNLL